MKGCQSDGSGSGDVPRCFLPDDEVIKTENEMVDPYGVAVAQ